MEEDEVQRRNLYSIIFTAISEELIARILEDKINNGQMAQYLWRIDNGTGDFSKANFNLANVTCKTSTTILLTDADGQPIATDAQHKIDLLIKSQNGGNNIGVEVKTSRRNLNRPCDVLRAIETSMPRVTENGILRGKVPRILSTRNATRDNKQINYHLYSEGRNIDRTWWLCIRKDLRLGNRQVNQNFRDFFANCRFIFLQHLLGEMNQREVRRYVQQVAGGRRLQSTRNALIEFLGDYPND